MASRGARRASFWLAVGSVSIFSNFIVQVLADKVPSLGLRQLVAYKNGNGGTG